jgi:hypothetical protein
MEDQMIKFEQARRLGEPEKPLLEFETREKMLEYIESSPVFDPGDNLSIKDGPLTETSERVFAVMIQKAAPLPGESGYYPVGFFISK